MTNQQIASFVNQAIRFKLTPGQLILIMDAVQKLGFDENVEAFQVFDQVLTTYQVLTFDDSGYTNAVAGDVGKTVVGATSGATGTLISYDNTAMEWIIETDDTFTRAEAISITTGTGAGTLADTDWQVGHIGPYDFPEDPPVRKMLGITTVTDAQVFGSDPIYTADLDDYGLFLNDFMKSRQFLGGRLDEIGETFTFASPPNVTAVYRWVYWQEAPDITGLDTANNAELLIPARYHFNFVRACIKVANLTIKGEPFTRKDVEEDLGPWWNTLRRPYTPNGKARNLTSLGSQSGEILV